MANSEPERTTVQQERDRFLAAHPLAHKAKPGEQSLAMIGGMENSAPEKTTMAQTLALLKAEPLAHKAKPGEQSPEGTTTLTFISPKSAD